MKESNRIYTCTCIYSIPLLYEKPKPYPNANNKLKTKTKKQRSLIPNVQHANIPPQIHTHSLPNFSSFAPLRVSFPPAPSRHPVIPSSCWYPNTPHPTPHFQYTIHNTQYNLVLAQTQTILSYPIFPYKSKSKTQSPKSKTKNSNNHNRTRKVNTLPRPPPPPHIHLSK